MTGVVPPPHFFGKLRKYYTNKRSTEYLLDLACIYHPNSLMYAGKSDSTMDPVGTYVPRIFQKKTQESLWP